MSSTSDRARARRPSGAGRAVVGQRAPPRRRRRTSGVDAEPRADARGEDVGVAGVPGRRGGHEPDRVDAVRGRRSRRTPRRRRTPGPAPRRPAGRCGRRPGRAGRSASRGPGSSWVPAAGSRSATSSLIGVGAAVDRGDPGHASSRPAPRPRTGRRPRSRRARRAPRRRAGSPRGPAPATGRRARAGTSPGSACRRPRPRRSRAPRRSPRGRPGRPRARARYAAASSGVRLEPVRHLPHQPRRLEGADQRRGPRAGQVEGGRERRAVGQPRLGGDHVRVAARAPVADRVDAARAAGRAGPRSTRLVVAGRSPASPSGSGGGLDLGRPAAARRRGRPRACRRSPTLPHADCHHCGRSGLGDRGGSESESVCAERLAVLVEHLEADLAGQHPAERAGARLRADVGRVLPALLLPLQRRRSSASRLGDARAAGRPGAAAGRGRPACSRRRTPSAPRGPAPGSRPGR